MQRYESNLFFCTPRRLDFDRWIDFSAICFGTLLHPSSVRFIIFVCHPLLLCSLVGEELLMISKTLITWLASGCH
jgi:hypothetical protein